ncbi:MAG: hypothetical protein JO006_11385 [Paucibacter sp.]|nr:hypothetical protein [Roseateles sp.]
MRSFSWATALAALAALCLLSAGSAVDAQQPDSVNLERVEVAGKKAQISKWFRAESQHFVVYSDTREEDVTSLLDNLERLDYLLRIYTQPAGQVELKEPKLTLYFHARLSGLVAIDDGAPADAVGLYSSCTSGVQGDAVQLDRIVSLGDGQLDRSPLSDSLSYVFEAYARHFLYRHTDIRTPASFIDGFAQYFSSVRFSEQQMVVGRVPKSIGNYLKFLDDGRRYSLEYDDVLQNKLANTHNYGGAAGVHLEYEAKAWLLMHYMLSSDDKRRRMNRYLVLVGDGASPSVAFERAFGVKTGDLGRVMWRYGLRGMTVLRVAPESLPSARISFRMLPKATGEFVLADAALKSCPGRQAGESLLRKVTALTARFPDDPLARLTLSRAQIDWGDPQQALSLLDADLQNDDANFEAWYLAGMANLRLAAHSEDAPRRAFLQAAQQHLNRAHALNPESPEIAFAFFQAEVAATDTPGDAALQGVIRAWQSAREVDALARYAALGYAYAGEADEAYRALGTLAQNVDDEPMARWAKQWRSRLEAGVTRSDILAEMRRDPASDVPFKEWTVDKQSAMQKVERSYGLEAADAFIKEQQLQQNTATQPSNSLGASGDTR